MGRFVCMNEFTIQLVIIAFILVIASLLFLILPSILQKNKVLGGILVVFIILAGAYHVNIGFNISITLGIIILLIYSVFGIKSYLKYKRY